MDCDTILYYRESLVKNAKVFDLHVQILRNTLTRKVIQAYLEEKQGYLAHHQKALERIYKSMTDKERKKFIWLKPFIDKRPDKLEADITRLLNDKDLRKKLKAFLDYAVKKMDCK